VGRFDRRDEPSGCNRIVTAGEAAPAAVLDRAEGG